MMKLCMLILIISFSNVGISQSNIKLQAKLMSASDYFEFKLNEQNNIDTLGFEVSYLESEGIYNMTFLKVKYRNLKRLQFYFRNTILKLPRINYSDFSFDSYKKSFSIDYDSTQINSVKFYENFIGHNKFISNEISYQCDFVICYINNEGRFFKLKGFKYNEFSELFYRYLMAGNVYLTPSVYYDVSKARKKKRTKTLLKLINVNELNLMNLYDLYVDKKMRQDINSCYRRDWLMYDY